MVKVKESQKLDEEIRLDEVMYRKARFFSRNRGFLKFLSLDKHKFDSIFVGAIHESPAIQFGQNYI